MKIVLKYHSDVINLNKRKNFAFNQMHTMINIFLNFYINVHNVRFNKWQT